MTEKFGKQLQEMESLADTMGHDVQTAQGVYIRCRSQSRSRSWSDRAQALGMEILTQLYEKEPHLARHIYHMVAAMRIQAFLRGNAMQSKALLRR